MSNSNRRTSFIEDPKLVNSERRQSIWNSSNQLSRKSTNRRMSFAQSHGSRKSSMDLHSFPRVRLQNTYKMEPDNASRFHSYKIEPRIYELLEHALKDKTYDANKSPSLAKELSQDIMRETKNFLSTSCRYKLVCHVVIGEVKDQDIRFGSRCLWDSNNDTTASVTYKNSSLYCVATLFAIYFE
jgi:tctex1 domain-containing protein 2